MLQHCRGSPGKVRPVKNKADNYLNTIEYTKHRNQSDFYSKFVCQIFSWVYKQLGAVFLKDLRQQERR